MTRHFQAGALILAIAATGAASVAAESILVQSTTSTANSGLYDHILPRFEEASRITVRVVAVGTGQAIRNAENCDGDVLLVHAKAAEEAFVAAGYGQNRHDLMYNDFVVVGPGADPLGLRRADDLDAALKLLASGQAPFASRGDDSGTHKKERALWTAAGIDPSADSGGWYRETGSGMGATLNLAVGMGAYTLTDRATWVSFENRADFDILIQHDPRLLNQYGVIVVNPDHCPDANTEGAQVFADWLLSTDGQAAIEEFAVNGQQLFFPNAKEEGKSGGQ